MKHEKDRREKIFTAIYMIICLSGLWAIALSYADGVVRDRYQMQLHTLELRQYILVMLVFSLLFLLCKYYDKSRRILSLLAVLWIPLFFWTVIVIGGNTRSLIRIVQGKEAFQAVIIMEDQTDQTALTPTGYPSDEIQRATVFYDGKLYWYMADGFDQPLADGFEKVGEIEAVDDLEYPQEDFVGTRVEIGQEIYASKEDTSKIYVKYEDGYGVFEERP